MTYKKEKKISNWKEDRNEREDGISKDLKTDTVNMLRFTGKQAKREVENKKKDSNGTIRNRKTNIRNEKFTKWV